MKFQAVSNITNKTIQSNDCALVFMFDKRRFNAVREPVLHFPYWNSADAGIVRKDELQGRDRRAGTAIILNIYLISLFRPGIGLIPRRSIFISRIPASGCQKIFSTSDKKANRQTARYCDSGDLSVILPVFIPLLE